LLFYYHVSPTGIHTLSLLHCFIIIIIIIIICDLYTFCYLCVRWFLKWMSEFKISMSKKNSPVSWNDRWHIRFEFIVLYNYQLRAIIPKNCMLLFLRRLVIFPFLNSTLSCVPRIIYGKPVFQVLSFFVYKEQTGSPQHSFAKFLLWCLNDDILLIRVFIFSHKKADYQWSKCPNFDLLIRCTKFKIFF